MRSLALRKKCVYALGRGEQRRDHFFSQFLSTRSSHVRGNIHRSDCATRGVDDWCRNGSESFFEFLVIHGPSLFGHLHELSQNQLLVGQGELRVRRQGRFAQATTLFF